MKRKFYDNPPAILFENEEDDRDFRKEICFISKLLGVDQRKIEIRTISACAEECIFVEGKWCGYLDRHFYNLMDFGIDEYGDYAEVMRNWWEDY